jgi:hypothetical protein
MQKYKCICLCFLNEKINQKLTLKVTYKGKEDSSGRGMED